MIETVGLSKRYGDDLVVDGVSLRLPAGRLTSIIGPNGAGKSTLLSLIGRLLPMSGGRASVAGLDVATTPGDALARRLAILRQENRVFARLTVRDLVGFGRYPHSRGRLTAADRLQVDRALHFLDLEPLAERYLDELSGGQRQRAFVAMVLAQDSDYVLLDEPLNNLDMKHAAGMMRLLRRAVDELGRTVVVVLHDINFASCYSDHIVAMKDGRVVAAGTPAEMISPATMSDIYGIDAKVAEIDGDRLVMFYR